MNGTVSDTLITAEETALLHRLLRPLVPIPTELGRKGSSLPPRVILFDIYGTLLISAAGDVGPDAAQDSSRAFTEALVDGGWNRPRSGEKGILLMREEIQREQEQKKLQGTAYPEIDILEIWRNILARLRLPTEDKSRIRLAALSYECRVNPVWPMPDCLKVLERIQERTIQLGILSNAQFYTPLLFEFFSKQSLVELGFEPDLCLFSYREGEGKPSPNLAARLAERLERRGIHPSEVLFVGNDMLKDITLAAKVGWRTALFAGDSRSLRLRENDPEVSGIQPDLVITELNQLLEK